jgi:hypothetical protein
MELKEIFGVWIAALLTIMVYSYLLGDNPLYRVAEHIFVGSAAGYAVVVVYHHVLRPRLFTYLVGEKSNPVYILPLLLGLLLLTKGKASLAWLGNTSMAFIFGVGAALIVSGALVGTLWPQVEHTMLSLNPADYPEYGWERAVDSLIIIIGTVGTLLYFHFSARDGCMKVAPVRFLAGIGRWVIMVAFGAIFAHIVMARMSLLIGRIQFLFGVAFETAQRLLGG